jgi:hypothetical protein
MTSHSNGVSRRQKSFTEMTKEIALVPPSQSTGRWQDTQPYSQVTSAICDEDKDLACHAWERLLDRSHRG